MSERVQGGVAPELARRLLEQLAAQAPDLRAAALLAVDGRQIAATDDADWALGTEALWRAVGEQGGPPGTEVHVATEDGEVFSIRGAGGTIVATTERFALSSLMHCDLRAVLRALGGAGP